MSKIIDLINSNNCDYLGKVDKNLINEAQRTLGIEFSPEVVEYISEFGVLSYGEHEINGLGTESYLNIIKSTINARDNINFPKDLVVIQDVGGHGLLILSDSNGTIYEWNGSLCNKIYNSFYDFLNIEIFS